MTPSCVRRNFCDSGGQITKHRDNRLKFAEDTRDLIVSKWRKVPGGNVEDDCYRTVSMPPQTAWGSAAHPGQGQLIYLQYSKGIVLGHSDRK